MASLRSAWSRVFPGRFAMAGVMLTVFLALNAVTRLGLMLFNQDWTLLLPQTLIPILLLGFVYDVAAASWWLVPFALLAAFWPEGPRAARALRAAVVFLSLTAFGVWVFTAASEFVFWNEFSSRFNFIAVDYLVYTNEVIGNIRQSYDLRPAFAAIALLVGLMAWLTWKPLAQAAASTGMPRRKRAAFGLSYMLLPALLFVGVDANYKEFTSQAQAVQLAGNGQWEFFRAFRTNEIDYEQFYKMLPAADAESSLKHELQKAGAAEFTGNAQAPFERWIRPAEAEKRLNVVMISVESLSGDFMAAFGNTRGLTPFLDGLAKESLFFTKLYSTGTRTVRGLEALSVGIPPTPGYSVVKRPHNENLFTIGSVFKSKGYEPIYLYGGYGYFDNMNYFFGNNGYTVVDRVGLTKEEVHHETIWGVADEDLFTLTLRELDQRYQKKQPFFAQVMTTSNHRPYTYPADRIDIPSGQGRDGAVKYTDWAIGDFIRRARAKPWFDETIFVIVADHCASSRGTTDIPIERFHIPMLIYAPKHIAPRIIDTVASQIDVPPTILALLNFSYPSRFFGQDILTEGQKHPRALMANYQTVAYMADGVLVELRPKSRYRVVDAESGQPRPDEAANARYVDAAIAYYQTASQAFRRGALKLDAGSALRTTP